MLISQEKEKKRGRPHVLISITQFKSVGFVIFRAMTDFGIEQQLPSYCLLSEFAHSLSIKLGCSWGFTGEWHFARQSDEQPSCWGRQLIIIRYCEKKDGWLKETLGWSKEENIKCKKASRQWETQAKHCEQHTEQEQTERGGGGGAL